MKNRDHSGQLLSVDRVKGILRADDPEYGRGFTNAEWGAITERLESLTRLIGKINFRRATEGQAKERVTEWVVDQV